MVNTTQLRKILTELYPSESDARRIVVDAKIEFSRIDFGGSAINIWHATLGEAEKSGRTNVLIEVVLSEYPDNSDLLTALDAYGYQAPKQSKPSLAPIESIEPELSSIEEEELQAALLHAFNKGSLTRMMRHKLDEDLAHITQGANHTEDVFNLIQWAIKQGRLADLIRGACETNSDNPKLKPFCVRFNQTAQPSPQPTLSTTVASSQTACTEQPRRQDPASGQYHSCFISYSSQDETFAKKLVDDLQAHGIDCWFAPKDMKIGARIRSTIHRSIRDKDKLLIVLSVNSIRSGWVETEVEAAFAQEIERAKQNSSDDTILFPIRIDDTINQATEAWAEEIRQTRHIGDFTGWQDAREYGKALERLLETLRVE